MIKVLVNGALGRMGSEVVKTVLEQEDMELVAAVDAFGADKMIPVKNGNQMAVATDLKAKLMVVKPDVVVDFTRPDVVMASLRTVLSAGVRAVVGTTGFSEADLDGNWTPYRPVGCDLCKGTGYKGRVGIYQVMPISEELNRIVMTGGNAIDIADQARREGIRDLRQSGLLKVKQGLTSLEEVMAVTNE